MTLDEIKKAVLELTSEYPIKSVILFGSMASGTYREDSDVDLIVEFSQPISLLTLSEIKIRLEDRLNVSVDLVHGPVLPRDLLEVNDRIELYTQGF